MDILLITAVSVKGPAPEVTIRVRVDGAPVELEFNSVRLPEAPRPLRIEITLDPGVPHLFGTTGEFLYHGEGRLVPQNAGAKAPHFRPVTSARIENRSAAMSLIGYVSRVRDATERVLDVLSNDPGRREGFAVPQRWNFGRESEVDAIADPPLRGGALQFSRITPELASVAMALEVAVSPAPKLIGVVWPDSVPRTPTAAPPPILLYFHSTVGQNFPGNYAGAYPFSWDFAYFGLFNYLAYDRDPLDTWGAKGMPYQIAFANRSAVYVLPVLKPFDEVGVMIDATACQDILEEITAFMFRKAGVFREPGLGRVALGAFSGGNNLTTRFLTLNNASPFCQNVLKEVYNFDIAAGRMPEWTASARAWLASGANEDKMLRVYTQQNHPNEFARIIGGPPPAAPFVAESADGLRTVACLPPPVWFPHTPAQMGTPDNFGVVHQLIAETLLTDAVRRSGFPRP